MEEQLSISFTNARMVIVMGDIGTVFKDRGTFISLAKVKAGCASEPSTKGEKVLFGDMLGNEDGRTWIANGVQQSNDCYFVVTYYLKR